MHHALAASWHFVNAAFRNMRLLRQLPLPGIAPERADGPKRTGGVDPGGLGGFLHLGLDVGVDFRGRGSQLSACHVSLPPQYHLQQRVANAFLPPRVRTDSVGDRRRRKSASPFHCCCTKAEAESLAPCRITLSSETLGRVSACLLESERSSIPDGDASSHAPMRFTRRHEATSTARPTQRYPNGLHKQDGSMVPSGSHPSSCQSAHGLLRRPTCFLLTHLMSSRRTFHLYFHCRNE